MTLKSALLTMATLTGIACIAGASFAGQDPRLDYSFAAPKLDDPVSVAQTTDKSTSYIAKAVRASIRSVSANFRNAPISDVLSWLKKQGVSYVMDEGIVRNKRISLNIENQPVSSVMDAIAAAMDGHWTRRGSIYVYRPGAGPFQGMTFATPDVFVAPKGNLDMKGLKDLRIDPKVFAMPDKGAMKEFKNFMPMPAQPFAWKGIDDKELAERISKEVQDALKDSKVNDPAFWERFGKELQESIQKNLEKHPEMMRGFVTPGDLKDLKELRIYANGDGATVRALDADKFMASVTPAQKELMKSQGYLKPSDLTPAQREMLDLHEGTNISLSFEVNGEKIVIKAK